MPAAPTLVIIAGPNGTGRSTVAEPLIRETLKVYEFVNADTIARGLSVFSPESVAFAADTPEASITFSPSTGTQSLTGAFMTTQRFPHS